MIGTKKSTVLQAQLRKKKSLAPFCVII